MKPENVENGLFREVQEKFQAMYPYLALRQAGTVRMEYGRSCEDFFSETKVGDEMNVAKLEEVLCRWFGCPVQLLRKCGNLWLETTMTRNWTVRQQNDLGWNITMGTL